MTPWVRSRSNEIPVAFLQMHLINTNGQADVTRDFERMSDAKSVRLLPYLYWFKFLDTFQAKKTAIQSLNILPKSLITGLP
jgi:hypothetical protein